MLREPHPTYSIHLSSSKTSSLPHDDPPSSVYTPSRATILAVAHAYRYPRWYQLTLSPLAHVPQPNRATTYKLRLPAIRGCVAQLPPNTTLCFPSKKSAVCISSSVLKKNTDSLTRILRICWLLAESFMANQDSAGPLPSSARRTSPQCHVAPPCHRCGMPVLEANIAPAKICEFRWRRLADAVINQVSTTVSMLPPPGEVRVVNSPVYSIDTFRERLLGGLNRFYICIHSTQLLL